MRKFFVIPAIALVLCLVMPAGASAHVLKTDGDTGAVLHIIPDDAPIAKEPVTYELSFESNTIGFSVRDCKCSVAYIMDGQMVGQQPLNATSTTSTSNTFTFSEPGVYTFRVTGEPKSGTELHPFTLNYTVRVGNGQSSMQPIPPLLWIGIGMGVALILLYANAQGYDEKINSRRKS